MYIDKANKYEIQKCLRVLTSTWPLNLGNILGMIFKHGISWSTVFKLFPAPVFPTPFFLCSCYSWFFFLYPLLSLSFSILFLSQDAYTHIPTNKICNLKSIIFILLITVAFRQLFLCPICTRKTSMELTNIWPFLGLRTNERVHLKCRSALSKYSVESIIPICQGWGFNPWLGHIQESTNECMNKWNNKLISLSF